MHIIENERESQSFEREINIMKSHGDRWFFTREKYHKSVGTGGKYYHKSGEQANLNERSIS